ncbi:MAG: S41 family peptidase [Patescibacteria group bacterium]
MKERQKFILGFKIVGLLLFFSAGIGAGLLFANKTKSENSVSNLKPEDKYIAFILEGYDLIKENYWNVVSDKDLIDSYVLAVEKIIGQPQQIKTPDKENLERLVDDVLNQIDSEENKKEFSARLTDMVLANLEPFGRSRLYTKKDEKDLTANVKNVTETDYYEVLGISKDAEEEEIDKAYQEKAKEWDPETNDSPEAEEKLVQANQAKKVLTDNVSRNLYDESGIDSTIDYRLVDPDIFYIHLKKFSPTTFDELKRITEKIDKEADPTSLIFDLRDNIGGAIDGLPYFLGPFIGPDQYAYQFFHQGEKEDYKTRTGWLPSLVRYKKVAVLINENTQSSAEVMAAVLKKYNVGILVGTTTKGWGTVERVFQMENQLDESKKHSMFLVHRLTLREDGQPIEGTGVDPVIDIKSSNWEKQLLDYFNYQGLVSAVKQVCN